MNKNEGILVTLNILCARACSSLFVIKIAEYDAALS